MIGRREFITLLGGAAVWPLAARAQQPTLVIGYLSGRCPAEAQYLVRAFEEGLRKGGPASSWNGQTCRNVAHADDPCSVGMTVAGPTGCEGTFMFSSSRVITI
jgi:hypothetical protein